MIGDCAFEGCKFTSINIPNSVTSIGKRAFDGCSYLQHVTFPNLVTEICDGTFWDCVSLESVTIPSGITSIGVLSFTNCWKLKKVYCYNATPPLLDDGVEYRRNLYEQYQYDYTCDFWEQDFSSFGGVDKENCVVYVPKGSGESYLNAAIWKDFKNIVEADMSGVDNVNYVKPASGPTQRYNLLGQPVGADYHGIVIENGKKMLQP